MGERRAAVVYDCLFPLTMGGGERVYRRIAELLEERGLRTDYVTRRLWDDSPPSVPFALRGVWKGEIYDDRGVRRTAASASFSFACFRYFVRRRREYDLVVASALPVLTALSVRLALLGARTRVIADWLEIWTAEKWRDYAGPVSGTLAAILQRAAVHMIGEHTVNSTFTAERLRSIRPGAEVAVLGLVDIAEEQVAGPADRPPFVLFVGRLIEDKRPELVPAVLAQARRSLPELRAVMVGEGPLRPQLEAIARATNGSFEVRGHLDEGALRALRTRAAVLLAPSVREGFGLVIAESAAAGVPVVVVHHPDNAAVDLVEPGVNGEIAAADDVDEIAAAVVRVIGAGQSLRATTLGWFRDARRTRGLASAIDRLLAEGSR